MKKWLISALVFATCAFGLQANAPTTPSPSKTTLPSDKAEELKFLDQVLADYTQGKYRVFLDKIDTDYFNSSHSKEQSNLLKERKKQSKLSLLVPDYQEKISSPFYEKMKIIQEKQNRELIEVCVHYPNAKLSREVKDMIFFTPTKQEQESLEYLDELSYKSEGEGKDTIENKLIAIDAEFWLKNLLCELAFAQKEVDFATLQEQLLVLQLEKLYQMQQVAQSKQIDPKLKNTIETACQTFPKVKAFALTRQHLIELGKEQTVPKTGVEKQMQHVMKKYLDQEKALLAEYAPVTNQ